MVIITTALPEYTYTRGPITVVHHDKNYARQLAHTTRPFSPKTLANLVIQAAEVVKEVQPEAILCRGMSGAEFAFPLSMVTKVPVGFCRSKKGAHSRHMYEGVLDFKSYIIVDDFIETGNTLRKIKNKARTAAVNPVCLGVICYEPDWATEEQGLEHHVRPIFGPECKLWCLND